MFQVWLEAGRRSVFFDMDQWSGCPSKAIDTIDLELKGRPTMECSAGSDVSLEITHICVLDRDGTVAFEASAPSSPEVISAAPNKVPVCRRVVLGTGRMAPMLSHVRAEFGFPVVCIESRQAYQALKTLATKKTDRNDARGLAQLAGTGFFMPVHVKSLPTHDVRALIMARKKLVGQRVALENQIRGLAVVFEVRLSRGLSPAFVEQAIAMSAGVAGLSSAMRGLVAARDAVLMAIAAIDADMRRLAHASGACRRMMTVRGAGPLTALAFAAAIDEPARFHRSRDLGACLGLVPRRCRPGEVDYTGSISKVGDRRVRTLLYEAANVMPRASRVC